MGLELSETLPFGVTTLLLIAPPLNTAPWERFESWLELRRTDVVTAANHAGLSETESKQIAANLVPDVIAARAKTAALLSGVLQAGILTAFAIWLAFENKLAIFVGFGVFVVALLLLRFDRGKSFTPLNLPAATIFLLLTNVFGLVVSLAS